MNICDIIYKSTVAKSDIKKLIHKTYYTNMKENFGSICLHGNTASLENIGVGEAEFVPLSKMRFSGCSGGAQKLADIHTHPSRNLFISEGDILDIFRRGLGTECIAVESEFKENRIRCYTLKNEHKNRSVYVDNLKKEIRNKYHSKARELDKLMEDSLNWFDYCDLEI